MRMPVPPLVHVSVKKSGSMALPMSAALREPPPVEAMEAMPARPSVPVSPVNVPTPGTVTEVVVPRLVAG